MNRLKINFDKPTILFTQHSITTLYQETSFQIKESLKALKRLSLQNDTNYHYLS